MSDDQYSSTVLADGTATIRFTPTKNRPWKLQQVSTEMRNAPSGAISELRKNGNLITRMVATDVADSDPPVPVVPGDRMEVNWTGGTPGGVVNVYIIYDEVTWEEL
jgi:hypothetical protein